LPRKNRHRSSLMPWPIPHSRRLSTPFHPLAVSSASLPARLKSLLP